MPLSKHKMELWAAGFNAHGQLNGTDTQLTTLSGVVDSALTDIHEFTEIARGDDIQVLYAGWSQTVVSVDGRILVLGAPLEAWRDESVGRERSPYDRDVTNTDGFPIKTGARGLSTFGIDSHGMQGLIDSGQNQLWRIKDGGPLSIFPEQQPGYLRDDGPRTTVRCPAAVAVTSAGTTAVAFQPQSNDDPVFELSVFDMLSSFWKSMATPHLRCSFDAAGCNVHKVPSRAVQLVANATSFVLLTQDGNVWTVGDARFPATLGRCMNARAPAEKPGLIDALAGVGIVKVAAGGWMGGCVSEAGEAWIWGACSYSSSSSGSSGYGSANSGTATNEMIESLAKLEPGEVAKVHLPHSSRLVATSSASEHRSQRSGEEDGDESDDVDDAPTIIDMAIGSAHILVLDSEGNVWGCGRNSEEQLGLGLRSDFEKGWVKVGAFGNQQYDEARGPWKVRSVTCGDLTSLALLDHAV